MEMWIRNIVCRQNKTDGDSDGDGVTVMAVIVGLLGVDGDEH